MFGRIGLSTNGRHVFHSITGAILNFHSPEFFQNKFFKNVSAINQFFDCCLQLSLEGEILEILKSNKIILVVYGI